MTRRREAPSPAQTPIPSAFPDPELPIEQLRKEWLKQFGSPPSRMFTRTFLARAIAWKMQVEEHGDISPSTRREMERLVAHSRAKRQGNVADLPVPPATKLRPGAQLVKVWRGETYVIDVLAEGFKWENSIYRSLSAVAKAITGTHWNGMIFFGLRERAEVERKRLGQVAHPSPKGRSSVAKDAPRPNTFVSFVLPAANLKARAERQVCALSSHPEL